MRLCVVPVLHEEIPRCGTDQQVVIFVCDRSLFRDLNVIDKQTVATMFGMKRRDEVEQIRDLSI